MNPHNKTLLLKKYLSQKQIWFFVWLVFFSLSQLFAQQRNLKSIDPNRKLTQYILDHWTSDNGLPSNNVRRLIQTKDGYLWMGGFDGMFSFDGVRFTMYDKKNVEQFQTNTVFVFAEDKEQSLWVGTQGSGLFSYRNGIFKKAGLDNFLMNSLFIESENRFWLSGRNTGLYTFNPQTQILQHIDYKTLSAATVYVIKKDKSGAMWFGTDGKGLVRLKDKKFTDFSTKQGLPGESVLEVFFDKNNILWAGTTKGLCYWEKDKFVSVKMLEGSIVYKVIEDASGSLWIASSSGLFRKNIKSGEYEQFPYREETPVTNVLDLLLDPEGSLWIATYRNGLFRLKDGKFTNHTFLDGLATTSVGSVCQLDKDKFLLGMNNGKINLLEGNKISIFPIKTPLPEVRVFNIFKDSKKNIWISTFNGLLKISVAGIETFYTQKEGLPDNTVRITFEDSRGNIWIGTRGGGLARLDKENKFTIYDKKLGLSSDFIMSIEEDKKGNIVVGTNDGGFNLISPKAEIKSFTIAQGLLNNLVFSTRTDKEGITWIASNGGISRFEEGKFTNYTIREGLMNDSPFDFMEDNFGNVWLPTSTGIVRVKKQQLNDFAKGKIKKIDWVEFDKQDGMKSEDCTGAAHSLKSSEGKIWVPTNGGIVVIDPQNMPTNHLPPKIRINSLWADGEYFNLHKEIIIKASKRRFVFDYSALSLLASSKVRFKFKIDGFDPDWIDGGTGRQAIYTNLPPGDYTFRVIACNNDGVWNLKGEAIRFSKNPYFYQTYWFYILSAFLILFLIYAYIRWRIYSIQQRKKELERLVTIKTGEIAQQNVELATQRDQIDEQKKLVEKKNQNITDSILYAKRIQEAILPPIEEIKAALPESFILFDPRDIVSGDFYWFAEVKERLDISQWKLENVSTHKPISSKLASKIILTAVDCTGHGVPGAFMSMIGNDLLNEIIKLRKVSEADKILNELHISINKTLKQQDTSNRDGMDLALCVIDKENKTLEFSGAKNSLYMIREGELNEIRGDKMPIGGLYKDGPEGRIFSKEIIKIDKPTWFYMFTDGYQDQFGEHDRKKFSRHRVRQLLLEIYQKPMETQKEILINTLLEWAGDEIRIDDVLVIGFRLD